MADVSEWFAVEFSEAGIELDVRPPGREPWQARIAWESIQRICYEAEDFPVSDGIYVFVAGREHSYAIPSEAQGGSELWGELVRRGLFDGALAIRAVSGGPGLYCWPPDAE